jgi:hypothetical protein
VRNIYLKYSKYNSTSIPPFVSARHVAVHQLKGAHSQIIRKTKWIHNSHTFAFFCICLYVSMFLVSVSLCLCVSVSLCLCVSVSLCLYVSVSLHLCVSMSLYLFVSYLCVSHLYVSMALIYLYTADLLIIEWPKPKIRNYKPCFKGCFLQYFSKAATCC